MSCFQLVCAVTTLSVSDWNWGDFYFKSMRNDFFLILRNVQGQGCFLVTSIEIGYGVGHGSHIGKNEDGQPPKKLERYSQEFERRI